MEEKEKVSLEKSKIPESEPEPIFIQQEIPVFEPEQPENDDSFSTPDYMPYQPATQQNAFDVKLSRESYMIAIVIFLLMIIIFALTIWFIILPMSRGNSDNIAENSFQGETAFPETFPAEQQNQTPETELPIIETVKPQPVYTVMLGKTSWETAEKKAVEMGGHLASIHSEEEWNLVLEAVNQAKASHPDLKYLWLGAVSELDTEEMTVMFHWSDDSDNTWLMNGNTHWYYSQSLRLSEPSGYDIHAYQKNGTVIREPYLMLWLPNNNTIWSLNDEANVTAASSYKDSDMGYIIQT